MFPLGCGVNVVAAEMSRREGGCTAGCFNPEANLLRITGDFKAAHMFVSNKDTLTHSLASGSRIVLEHGSFCLRDALAMVIRFCTDRRNHVWISKPSTTGWTSTTLSAAWPRHYSI